MDSDLAREKGMKPMVRIVDYVTTGVKPELLMEAPIHAVRKLLQRNKLEVKDIDLWEHNEAFSTASVATMKVLGIPEEKFNVNGGAVALGHPIGCSGARVLTTLIYAMRAHEAKRGLATLCLGGGNAVAMIVER
jgi:acetyl-CoA C-acetyltransferase